MRRKTTRLWEYLRKECRQCQGVGIVQQDDWDDSGVRTRYVLCSYCKGTGIASVGKKKEKS